MNTDSGSTELRQAFSELKTHWWKCIAYSWTISLLVLASTAYMFQVYDRVVNSRNSNTLWLLTFLVILIYILMEMLEWFRSETLRAMGMRLDAKLTPRLLDVTIKSRLQGSNLVPEQALLDLRTLRDGLLNPVVSAAMESPISLVFLIVLFSFHPLLGWASTLGAMFQVAITGWNERNSKEVLKEAGQASMAAQASVNEVLRHTDVIMAMGMQKAMRHRWGKWQDMFVLKQAQASDLAGTYQALSKWLQLILSSMLLGLGAYLLLINELPGGGGLMIVASVLGGRVLAPLVQAVNQWRSVTQMREAWTRLTVALTKYPSNDPSMQLPSPKGNLVAESIWVQPPTVATNVVRNISLSIPAGQCLGVLGPSGSGKTSLLRALIGLWPTSQGKVRLDGAEIFSWNKAELGPNIGYLPQSVDLIDGTVGENITRFSEVDTSALEMVLTLTKLEDLINELPLGLQTELGRNGANLSAGQRQRIGLARALYGMPKLVVLDEPSAHMDTAGQKILIEILYKLKEFGTTIVLTTHKTELISAADQLLVMQQGAAQAYGPRNDVIRSLQK